MLSINSRKTMLRAENLNIYGGGLPLLENLSFDLKSGQGLQICGPNGIGKTLFIKSLIGLHPFYTGTKTFAPNQDFHYVGVEMPFDDTMSLYENFLYLGHIQQIPLEFETITSVFGITDFIHQKFKELSWGQKQRANLSLLFLKPAPLWILDEPFQHLDAQYKKVLENILTQHMAQGGAVLIAEHDMSLGLPQLHLQNFLAAA